MIDEATDCMIKAKLLTFYRYASPLGKLVLQYAGCDDLSLGKGAAVITAVLMNRLTLDGISMEKVVCIGSDGASVMIGHLGGVAARLCQMNCVCIGIHCVCHRYGLVNKDAFSLSPYIKHVFLNYVEFLFRYFDFSSNRASIFSRIQQLRGETQLKLVRNGFTRWLTHDNVTRSIKLTFISLILALDELAERGDELADGLLNYNSVPTNSCLCSC